MPSWTVQQIPSQADKVALITGANTGIGFQTALVLAERGATVILACRDTQKAQAAQAQILAQYPNAHVKLLSLDLANLADVRRAAAEVLAQYTRLDLLINNAGVMVSPLTKTADGFELQFATNHLGHFALTGLLMPLLTHTPKARVVTVSSMAHHSGRIDFDNLNAEKSYSPRGAYAQSKLANLLFTLELNRRFSQVNNDTIAVSAHPGWTATELQKHSPIFAALNPFLAQTAESGAWPTLYAATVAGVRANDFYGPSGFMELRGIPKKVRGSTAAQSLSVSHRLWKVSETLTGVKY